MVMTVGVSQFGMTADGRRVDRVVITAGDLTVSLLTWGAIVQGVWLKGTDRSLTLGSETFADYLGQMRHHGVLIAPVVNRFTGATARIGGVEHHFAANQDGKHTLHSGPTSAHLQLWQLKEVAADRAVLEIDLPDGLGGFPGNRHVRAEFSVAAPASLRMKVTADTDKLTLFNAANHSYWNLDGTSTWAGHSLQIAADQMLPTTADFNPTGEVRPVTGTEFDFRQMRQIAPGAPLLDNSFCLGTTRVPLRDVLWLKGQTGTAMTVATTEPGIQLYDGRNAIRPGHGAHEGVAIEAQNWPDAPNHAGFPSIELKPGEVYQQITEWRFQTGR